MKNKHHPNTPTKSTGHRARRHIAIATDTFTPDVNGVAMTLSRLASGLIALGHRVTVISHTGTSAEFIPDRAAPNIVHVPSLPCPGYPGVRIGLPASRRLRKLWANPADRPDTVYVATESPFGATAIKTARALGIPVASGFHTNFHHYADHYRLPFLKGTAAAWLRRLHNKSFRTFAPSEHTAAQLRADGYNKVYVLGRGVDTALFSPAKRDTRLRATWGAESPGRPSAPVALFVGRIAHEKNLDLLAETFHHLLRIHPGTRCVLVGDGPCLAGFKERHIHPQFHYAGVRRGEDLARYYASADLFISPSLSETYGNTVPEAMASGLATVAFDYAAPAQLIRDGENGYLAPFDDTSTFLAKAAQALRQHPDSSLRAAARRTVLGISWENVTREFADALTRPNTDTIRILTRPRTLSKFPRSTGKAKRTLRFKTVFLSDIHLGTADSKVTQVIHFLRNVRCEKLVLNGDIIDAWSLKRFGKWTRAHTYFVRLILKKMAKEGTEIIYLRGNHDDVLTRFLPMTFDRLHIVNEHVHESPHGKYLVVHGDGFDATSTRFRWLSSLGGYSYGALLRLNRLHARYRRWRGKPAFSLAKAIKAKVKSAVSFIGNYESQLQSLAKARGCQGIICGHIHTPADKRIGDIHYLNSGDWVESLTAVVENLDRTFAVLSYEQFCHLSGRQPKGHFTPIETPDRSLPLPKSTARS